MLAEIIKKICNKQKQNLLSSVAGILFVFFVVCMVVPYHQNKRSRKSCFETVRVNSRVVKGECIANVTNLFILLRPHLNPPPQLFSIMFKTLSFTIDFVVVCQCDSKTYKL